jgi:hypothetical protein
VLTDDGDEVYAEVASAMELAFVAAYERRPELSKEELFVALLLLKDRILERHVSPEELQPNLASVARKLYSI